MKTIALTLISTFFLLTAFAQDSDAIDKQLRQSYLSFLKEEGYAPIVDSDGDVKFKYEGSSLFIRPTGSLKRFAVYDYLSTDNIDNYDKLLQSANYTMNEVFGVRAVVHKKEDKSGCYVIIEVRQYLVNEDDYRKVFYKCLSAIQSGAKTLKEHFNQ